jgi:hypothetical protein
MMRVRLRYSSRIARLLDRDAITLYPFVLVAHSKAEVPRYLVEHEFVHVRQVRALGWWRFYVSYVWEYLGHLIWFGSRAKAYRAVSFEIEAYEKERTVTLTAEERAEVDA